MICLIRLHCIGLPESFIVVDRSGPPWLETARESGMILLVELCAVFVLQAIVQRIVLIYYASGNRAKERVVDLVP